MPSSLLTLIACLSAVAAAALWSIKDFARWKSLGPGGLPHSPAGWLAMSFLRLLKRDGRDSRRLASAVKPGSSSYLGNIVRRQGVRPIVAPQPIPQRQLNDTISSQDLARLQNLFEEEVESNQDVIHFAQSFFEKHHDAITMRHPECGHVYALISQGEIAHIHPSDGSMHMMLSPCDAKAVLENEWGELHSLAGLFNRLPVSYTFVYAPRSEADLEAVQQMLSASVAFMTKRHPAQCTTATKDLGPTTRK
jgi:hypothetical protein